MDRSPPLSPSQRFNTICVVVVLHAVALGLFLTAGGSTPTPKLPSPAMSLIEIAVANPKPSGAPPPPPTLPSKVASAESPPAPPSVAPSPTGTGLPGGGCATLASVSAAINGDLLATAQIRNVPPQLQSVAGAVVLWNAGWSAGAQAPAEPLEGVRKVIEATLRTVEPVCLDEQVAGPRLIAIPTGDHSMYVVLGSGLWTWRQLLEEQTARDNIREADREPQSWIDWF